MGGVLDRDALLCIKYDGEGGGDIFLEPVYHSRRISSYTTQVQKRKKKLLNISDMFYSYPQRLH